MITLSGVVKSFDTPAGIFPALRGIDLEIDKGELVAVVGKSGSGKSTLLNMIAGIDRPSAGSVSVSGTAIQGLTHNQLAAWRGRNVGIVFQFFQLLPALTVIENVMLPMDFCGAIPARERRKRALDLLGRVDIAAHAAKLPSELSGGQQQRAAIARALANDPPVVLADEPTGNLDSATSADIFQLFAELGDDGKTVVVVTHERDAGSVVDRVITLIDGSVAP
ncbi:MAG TPA: ABC transporter ATP-binding protein [Thermoanaerobaculia bacterium]|nr:ABC transporter ATP-binding protein [Thermoanaerobaculia bacterium]